MQRHPRVFLLRVTRAGRTSEGPRIVEAVLAIASEAGFDDRTTVLAVETITSFVTGHVIAEVGGRVADELEPAADSEAWPSWLPLPSPKRPLYRSIAAGWSVAGESLRSTWRRAA